jgi:uroporphyrin-III C-methyltransferase
MRQMADGKVFLVGAGPGAADLITLRGARCLEQAEVVVYDRLSNDELLALAPRSAELVYAGKRKRLHVMSQQAIGELLVCRARAGRRVVRLKGGDCFVFGRGGEEVDALIEAGVDWEVVPGITAASGAAAMLGLPLTHRDEAQAVTFVTAHRRHGALELDWPLVLRPRQTVVFYMGLSLVHDITGELLARGKSGSTPFTVISNATRPGQRSISAPLRDISARLRELDLPSPALLIMGPEPRTAVSGCSHRRHWSESADDGGR